MNQEEIADLATLPHRLQLFRGGFGESSLLRSGCSWTPDRSYAEEFANLRADGIGAAPSPVVSVEVRKDDAIALYRWGQGGREVVYCPDLELAIRENEQASRRPSETLMDAGASDQDREIRRAMKHVLLSQMMGQLR